MSGFSMNDSLIGTILGGYEIVQEIGQGGMATVYRAHQLSMNRDVAIKVLPPHFVRQTASLERFKQEANIVSRLEHRAIVPVHDYGEYEGIPYIVMRYMDGGSVDELLTKGPISPEITVQILEQIAPALDYAHREGVLHRDLKPSNILLDSNGDAYITDFGIARILGSNNKLTTSGVVGTPSYMSPEQAQGHDLDGRSDIYALGVVLYEMLAGVRPFEGETPYNIAVKHVTEPPPSPCGINPKLSRAIEQVLLKALAKSRDARYATAVDLAHALKTATLQNNTPEGMIETEPSLNEAVRSAAIRRIDVPPPLAHPPLSSSRPIMPVRQPAPNLQVMPAYEPSQSRAFTGPVVIRRRKKKKLDLRSWVTWTVLAVFTSGVLLASVVLAIYYIMDSSDVTTETPALVDYEATAVYKMTATRDAIRAGLEPTIPATNTLRPAQTPNAATSNE